jgi:2-desacetyl-2-hydroxyethyl bacteriochlorophyllide A dehydrogenase
MKAINFLGDGKVALVDVPDPSPGPEQVVVRVQTAAVCGTDIHLMRRTEAEQFRLNGNRVVPGHEPAGIVAELGQGVKSVKVGERVVVYGIASCGRCKWCRSGYVVHCKEVKGMGKDWDGGDAEYILAPARNCISLPEYFPFEVASTLACAGITAYQAAKDLKLSGVDTVAIFGLGPVGLCAGIIARQMGARIIGVDVRKERLELAISLGFGEVLDGREVDPVEAIRDLTNGEDVNAAMECVGSIATQRQMLEVLSPLGRAILVGLDAGPLKIDLESYIINKQLTLTGAAAHKIDSMVELLTLTSVNRLLFDKIITHRIPLVKAEEAFGLMATGTTGKVILTLTS